MQIITKYIQLMESLPQKKIIASLVMDFNGARIISNIFKAIIIGSSGSFCFTTTKDSEKSIEQNN